MSKKITLSILLLITVSSLHVLSQPISSRKSLSYAQAFRKQSPADNVRASAPSTGFKLVYTGGNVSNPDYYVYNEGNDNGFIIIAGDERMEPILGYSLSGHFDVANIPDGLAYMLNTYSENIREIRQSKVPLKNTQSIIPLTEITQVGPLLGNIAWSQSSPYNDQCPIINGQRAVTGCVATATGQVMRYHSYPPKGTGSKGGINFGATTYNWENMLPTYNSKTPGTTEQRAEVAKLLHHIGVSVDMSYNLDGSGSSNSMAAYALKNYFAYSKGMERANRVVYTDEQWIALIKNEIDNNRPILYEGTDGNGNGHSFVCDGYDNTGKVHFNYGWNGASNAFLTVAANRFRFGNNLIIGISPTEVTVAPQVSLLSSINVSNLSPQKGKTFKVGINVTNYGINNFNGTLGIALYQGGKQISVLKEKSSVYIPVNPNNGNSQLPTHNIDFTDIIVPSSISNGTYQLCCVAKKNGQWFIMPGLSHNINMLVSGNKISFNYPISESQTDLELSGKLEMSVANNVGIARFALHNPDTEYDYNGSVYILGRKADGTVVPAVFASTSVSIPASGNLSVEIPDISLFTGDYTFYVGYSPVAPNGTGISAIPLLPASLNFYSYNVPAEIVDYSLDFNDYTELPTGFIGYKDSEPDNSVWFFSKYTHAMSLLWDDDYPEDSHTLVTEKIHVNDEYAVLAWGVSTGLGGKGDLPYEVYISTAGQDIGNFTEKELVYKNNKSLIESDISRYSLQDYVGQDIYVAIKHLKIPKGSVICIDYIKVLNINSPKDISAQQISMDERGVIGETYPVTVTVRNAGAFPVKLFNATFTSGTQVVTQEFPCHINYDQTYTFTFTEPVRIEGDPGAKQKVNVKINLEGESPYLLDNNSLEKEITLITFVPHKTALVYKVTKPGCLPCMTSYTALDECEELSPGSIACLEIWNGKGEYYGGEFATAFFNGTTPEVYMDNVYYAAGRPKSYEIDNSIKKLTAPADVRVEAYFINDSRTMKIKVTSNFALPQTGDFRMGAFVFENDVIAPGIEIANGTPSGNKRTKNHLPIVALGGVRGATGLQFSNPQINEEYVYEQTYTLPEETVHRYKKEHVQVIGVLFDSKGKILNCGLNEYNIRINNVDKLTYVSEEGYAPFVHTNDVVAKTVGGESFISISRYKSTVAFGKDFRFRVEKDASIADKKIKITIKKGNSEEELIPDLDGMYTLKDVRQHYFLSATVLDKEEDRPIAVREGTQIKLSGNWKASDFNRLDLSDMTLTSVDMTKITIPQDVANIVPANANLLIYTLENASAPLSWKNVVKGSEADKIELTDGYAFNSTKEFIAKEITYKRTDTQTGWYSIYLPFGMEVTSLPEGVSVEEYTSGKGSTVDFKPITSAKTEPNTPYIVHTAPGFEPQKVYSATNTLIPQSVSQQINHGSYTFSGTSTPIKEEYTTEFYILNPDGKSFSKSKTPSALPAFRGYMECTGEQPQPEILTVVHKGDVTGTQNFKVNSKDKEVTDGQIIEISEYSEDPYGEAFLKLNLSVETTKELTMTLSKDDNSALPNTKNDICWEVCSTDKTLQQTVKPGKPSELYMSYYPGKAVGTSRIVYTFRSSVKGDSPLTINVDFVYNGKGSSIEKQISQKHSLFVSQATGTKCFILKSTSEVPSRITISDLSGRMVEETFISNDKEFLTKSLSNGCYLITCHYTDGIIITKKAIIQ